MLSDLHHLDSYAKDDTTRWTAPLQHVDYFSHKWIDEEARMSWRLVVSQKGSCEQSARLENASWRLWTKTKQGLQTIPPEHIQWGKGIHASRLYGPLERTPANLELYASCSNSIFIKSILKHSTGDIMLLGDAYTPRSAYSACNKDSIASLGSDSSNGTPPSSPKEHIRFNKQVEQRIINPKGGSSFDKIHEGRQPLVTDVTKLPNAALKSAIAGFGAVSKCRMQSDYTGQSTTDSSGHRETSIRWWDATIDQKPSASLANLQDIQVMQAPQKTQIRRRSRPLNPLGQSRFLEDVESHADERIGILLGPSEKLDVVYSLLKRLFWAVMAFFQMAAKALHTIWHPPQD